MDSSFSKLNRWALLATVLIVFPSLEAQVYTPSDDPGPLPEGSVPPPDAAPFKPEVFSSEVPSDGAPALSSIPGAWLPQGPGPISNGQVEGMTDKFVCGAIHTVITHPTDANIIYIGAVNGGVWKTTNATASSPTWTTATGNMPSLSIGALTFDPLDPTSQTVWAGTGRFSSYYRYGGSRAGLLKTTDGGTSWTVVNGGGVLNGKNISGIVVRGNTVLVSVNTADSSGNTHRGVWRSTNGGSSFTQMAVGDGSGATGLPEGVAYDIVSSAATPNTIYTSIAIPSTASARGIYKSTDLGATWTRISTTTMNNRMTTATSNIEMSAGDANNVVLGILEAGAPVGIFHSVDAGATWQEVDLPTMPIVAATVYDVTNATNASPIVITTSAPHGYSNNNYVEIAGVAGNTGANGLHQITVVNSTTFSLDFSVGNGAYLSGGTARLVTSMNPRGSKGPEEGAPDEIAGGQGSIHFAILAHPTGPNLIFVGGDRQDLPFPNYIKAVNYSGNLWRGDASVAGNGLSPSSQWQHLTHSNSVAGIPGGGTSNNSSPHADSRDMSIDANGQLVEVDDGGIFRRSSPGTNTGAWTSMAGNLQVTEAHSIVYDTVSNVIITGNQDNGTSVQNTPGSIAYTAISTADGGDVAVAPNPANPSQSIRYSSFQNLGSFRKRITSSTNTLVSQSFPALTPQGGAPAITGQFVTPIEINSINANFLLIGGGNGVYESTDQGATVSRISTLDPNDGGQGGRTMSYGGRKDGVDNVDVVYFAESSAVYRRIAAGVTPAAVAGYSGGTVRGIIVDPEDYNHLFAIDNNQVFRSTNGGASFTDITGDIPAAAKDFRCLEFIRDGADWAILVGTLRGVYAAVSSAPTDWGVVGTDLPNAYVWDMDYDASDNVLVVATLGRGAWKFPDARSIVGSTSQTITFAPIADQITTNTFTLSATGGGSGNPVTFVVTSGPAVIGTSNLVSFTGAGSVTITASQEGNEDYLPAEDVSRTFNVTRATATISLAPLSQSYTGTARTVTATTNPSSLPVTITYNGVSPAPTNAGSYTVAGTVDTAMYQGSTIATLVVAKAAATVTLSNLSQVYNGSARPVGVTTVPGGLSYSLTYNGVPAAPFNAGSYAVDVIVNNINYTGAASATLVVDQASQTISFPALADTVTTATVNLAATGGASGNPVAYAVTEGPGNISGDNQLNFTGAGLVRVVASQAGSSNYLAAVPVERTVTVSKAVAQILLSGLNPVYNGSPQGAGIATSPGGLGYTVTYGGSATEPTAAGTYPLIVTISDPLYEGTVMDDFVIEKAAGQVTLSGLALTYTGSPQGAVATTDPAGAPVVFTYDGLSDLPVTAGSYAVVATINHPSIQGSASDTLVIAKAPQTIHFPTIPPQFATDTVMLSASGGGSNNNILFTVTEGPAAISGGNSLTFSGSGDVSIQATQAGNDNYLAATPVTRSFTVSKFPATVTLSNLAQAYDGTPRVAGATTDPAGLNLVLRYQNDPDPPVLPGTYFVIAYIDEAYYEGDDGDYLVISKGTQSITFPAIPPQTADEIVTLSAAGGESTNPVTFEIVSGPGSITGGNQLSFTASGTVTVRANQAGNTLYDAAAPVEQSVTVNKATATVTYVDLTATYDGGPHAASVTTVPAGLAVSFTYDGLGDEPVGAGSYDVVATIHDPRYLGNATAVFVVEKADQAILFPAIPPRITTDTENLSATGGASGSPVTFAVTGGPGVISDGSVLTFTGSGEVEITASQDGGVNHLPAPPVVQTLVVTKAVATLTLAPLRQVHDGSPREVLVTSDPPGLGHLVTYDGDPGVPTATGSYEVTATLDDPLYQGSITGTLIVDDPAVMILVPGGELPAISPLGPLDLPTFELSRYEVTWGLWREVRDWSASKGYDISAVGNGCADDHPVRNVNWYDAVKWCNARTQWENELTGSTLAPAYGVAGDVYRSGEPALLTDIACDFGTSGYRLPTGGEWEYAARGGAGAAPQTYPGGEDPDLLAWYVANSAGAACDLLDGRGSYPVAYKEANTAGFHDLAGNLAEWTWDAEPDDATSRLVSGGSWDSAPAALALGAVSGQLPGLRDNRIGFRVGRSVALALGEAVDLPSSEWESGINSIWIAQTGVTFDGVDAAASGPLSGGGETHMETTFTGPGNVSFRWKVNLPTESGKFIFTVGGIAPTEISGDSGWVEGTAYVPPGDQVVRWTLIRVIPSGASPDPADTGAWLDDVVYTPASAPELSTTTASAIDGTSAASGGEVTGDGGSPVTARGVIIGLSPDPAFGGGVTDFPAPLEGTSNFEVMLTPLLEGTTYHARAYATNAAGTGYGESLVFTTDTTLSLPGELDEVARSILPGDRHVFHFTLSGPRQVSFTTLGGASLRAQLYDSEGILVAFFDGDSDVVLEAILYPGDYSLHLFRQPDPGAPVETFELALDATVVVETRPDVAVGASLTAVAGVGIYNTFAGQLVGYTSVRARAVSALATFRNAGTLPDELVISGTRGTTLFRIVYTDASANITARIITGTYRTASLAAGDEVSWVRATVIPNKKKLVKKKKGTRPRILKRSQLLRIRASSAFDSALDDSGYIKVQTK